MEIPVEIPADMIFMGIHYNRKEVTHFQAFLYDIREWHFSSNPDGTEKPSAEFPVEIPLEIPMENGILSRDTLTKCHFFTFRGISAEYPWNTDGVSIGNSSGNSYGTSTGNRSEFPIFTRF